MVVVVKENTVVMEKLGSCMSGEKMRERNMKYQ